MKAAAQLGKHWGQVKKEDIPNVKLSPQEMQILESIFNTQYYTAYEDNAIPKTESNCQSYFVVPYGIEGIYTEQYDNLEDLIVHEMIEQESKLDDAHLLKMSQTYGIPFADLVKVRPIGEEKLKKQLEEFLDIKDSFEYDSDFLDCAESED
jgi:hypothetical protein